MFLMNYNVDRLQVETDQMVDLVTADLLHTCLQKMHSTHIGIKLGRNCLRYNHHDFEILQQMSFTSWNEDVPDLLVVISVERTVLLQ